MRPSDIFARFFDARYIATFVLGLIATALFTNALYDLLNDGLPKAIQPTWLILGGSLVFMVVAYWALWWLNSRARSRVDLPSVIKAPKRKGLILLVSPGEGKSDLVAINHHSDLLVHCWFITTDQTLPKVQNSLIPKIGEEVLQGFRREDGGWKPNLWVSNATSSEDCQQIVGSVLDDALRRLSAQELVVDITGGTKPMSIGAFMACIERGVDAEYVVSKRDAKGNIDFSNFEPTPMLIGVSKARLINELT